MRGRKTLSSDFVKGFWPGFWAWYNAGGMADVVAYLTEYDLSKFDPKAPPRKTEAFWQIVGVGAAPEEAELADILDALGAKENALDADGKPCGPVVTTLAKVLGKAEGDLFEWLKDRKNRRVIPHRFEACGYTPVRNSDAKDRLWVIGRQATDGLRAAGRPVERADQGSPEAGLKSVKSVKSVVLPLFTKHTTTAPHRRL